jgi:hypothetical protein
MLECQSGQTNGFVTLRLKREPTAAPSIPDHLHGKHLPEPLLWQSKNGSRDLSVPKSADNAVAKSCVDVTSELENVQEKLARLKEARAARVAAEDNTRSRCAANSNIVPRLSKK